MIRYIKVWILFYLLLSFCVNLIGQEPTNWMVTERIDNITGSKDLFIQTISIESQNLNYIESKGSLIIRVKSGKIEIYVSWGGFISTEPVQVSYKIGDYDNEKEIWALSSDYEGTFAKETQNLLIQLSTSEIAYFRTTPFQENPITYSFNISGLNFIIEKQSEYFKDFLNRKTLFLNRKAMLEDPNYQKKLRLKEKLDAELTEIRNGLKKQIGKTNWKGGVRTGLYYTHSFPDNWRERSWRRMKQTFNINLPNNQILFYYEKDKNKRFQSGIVFTNQDIRIKNKKNGRIIIIRYDEIETIRFNRNFIIGGNMIFGFKMIINGEKVANVHHHPKSKIKILENFISSMISFQKKVIKQL